MNRLTATLRQQQAELFQKDVRTVSEHIGNLFEEAELQPDSGIRNFRIPAADGKLNFYCNVVNDRLKHPTDAPTIGLILCQTRDQLLAEYSFAGIDKPIGISTDELTRALPARLQSALPTVEEIEAELAPKRRMR